MGSAGGGSEWQEEYYVRSRQYLTRGVPNNQRWRQHILKPYTLGRLHIGRAPAGMLYVLVWNSVFYRDLADVHFPYTYSLQSSMCKCSAHRFAKLSIRGTVGFYWEMLPFISISYISLEVYMQFEMHCRISVMKLIPLDLSSRRLN